LDDLKELANDANKALTQQKCMLEQVDQKMDDNIRQFKTANSRLKTMLQKAGGCSRLCPLIICTIVLLALLGNIVGITK
jgi:hypothetical protein